MFSSGQIRIDGAYRDALADAGLLSARDIIERTGDRVAAWSRTTDTVYAAGPNGRPGFYLKRYFYSNWRKRLRGAFRGTFFGAHRALAEHRALQAMRRLGIPAVRPVAYGARRIGRFVRAAFLVTEEVPDARNLTSFASDVRSGRAAVAAATRRRMCRRLAEQVAAMHTAGFLHGQLFWRNILVRLDADDEPEFFFLDARPPAHYSRLRSMPTLRLREIASLAASAAAFTTRTERMRFMRDYAAAAGLPAELKTCWREIHRYAGRLKRHERQRVKMNDLFDRWNQALDRERDELASAGSQRGATP